MRSTAPLQALQKPPKKVEFGDLPDNRETVKFKGRQYGRKNSTSLKKGSERRPVSAEPRNTGPKVPCRSAPVRYTVPRLPSMTANT